MRRPENASLHVPHITVGSVIVIHQGLVTVALRYIEVFLTQLIRNFPSLVMFPDGVGTGGECVIDGMILILFLLPHHGAVLPAGHAAVLGRKVMAVFGNMGSGR